MCGMFRRERKQHVLDIDESDNRPELCTVIKTAGWYQITTARAQAIVDEVLAVTQHWRELAVNVGIARIDVELSAVAFAQTDAFRR